VLVRKRSPTHQGIVYLVPPPGVNLMPFPAIAMPMSSIASAHSSNTSPTSADSSLREESLLSERNNSVEEEEDEKTASNSAPSSPKGRRSFHRRQHSQSLDNINIEETGTANFVPQVRIGFSTADKDKEISPVFNLLGSDDSDSESDTDEEIVDAGTGEHKEMSNLQESGEVMPSNELPSTKESEEDGEGGMWKLSQLKGMFFSKVKSSTTRFGSSNEVTNKSHSINMSPDEDVSNDIATEGDSEQGRGSGGGSQWMGLVKQRLRSPNLWRKMRKMSPSSQISPAVEDLDLTKLEDARKKCQSRIISL